MEQLSFQLDVFEGPLDLLLHLISKAKLNIYDINISALLEQYLEHIRQMREQSMDVASEFLEMAARLVYIKSAALLPRQEEADALRDALSGELLEYQVCRKIAADFGRRTEGFGRFVREPAEVEPDRTYRRQHDPELLVSSYLAAVGRGMRRLPPPESSFREIVQEPVISVSSRIVFLLRAFGKQRKISYRSIFTGAKSRSELVATFLAVLQLISAHRVAMNGEGENAGLSIIGRRKNT